MEEFSYTKEIPKANSNSWEISEIPITNLLQQKLQPDIVLLLQAVRMEQ